MRLSQAFTSEKVRLGSLGAQRLCAGRRRKPGQRHRQLLSAALRLRRRLVLRHLVRTPRPWHFPITFARSQDPGPGIARGISVLSAFRSGWLGAEGWPPPERPACGLPPRSPRGYPSFWSTWEGCWQDQEGRMSRCALKQANERHSSRFDELSIGTRHQDKLHTLINLSHLFYERHITPI